MFAWCVFFFLFACPSNPVPSFDREWAVEAPQVKKMESLELRVSIQSAPPELKEN